MDTPAKAASSLGSLGSLPTAARKKLVDQGLHFLIKATVADLKADDLSKQLQALHALKGLTKQSRAGIVAVQIAFQEAGGIPLLIHVIDATNTGKDASPESLDANITATEALFSMTRNSAENKATAIKAGAIPALAGLLGSGTELAPSLDVLRALHGLITLDSTGEATTELFASGGVHALVKLLGTLLDADDFNDREVWTQEVLALLEPAARCSRLVAHLLTSYVAIFCRLLTTHTEPLSLSLGLDILEEVLLNGDKRKTARKMAEQGVLAALLHAVRLRGLGSKAANLVASLTRGHPLLFPVLRALLQPPDIAALVRTAAHGQRAEDVEAVGPAELLGELLCNAEDNGQLRDGSEESAGSLSMLRSFILACCIGACLSMQPIREPLLRVACSPAGRLVLRNMPARNATEAAVAAAQLLSHMPSCAEVLQRPGLVASLVAAFLQEHTSADFDLLAGLEATSGVTQILRTFPDDGEDPASPGTLSRLEEAAPQIEGNGDHAEGNGSSYGTITFHVGGREVYALGWVLEQASPAIARTLAAIPDPTSAAVVIPDVNGLTPERLHNLFGVAVDFAYSRSTSVDPSDALDLWAVAAVLQMDALLQHCEKMAADMLSSDSYLEHALHLTSQHPISGRRLQRLCCRQLSLAFLDEQMNSQLSDKRVNELLSSLVPRYRPQLQAGYQRLLQDCIDRHRRHAANGAAGDLLYHNSLKEDIHSTGSFTDWIRDKDGSPVDVADAVENSSSEQAAATGITKSHSLRFPVTSASTSEIQPQPA